MYKRSVGLFYSRDEAERALRALKDDGFDMKRVNVIAKDADRVTESAGVDVASAILILKYKAEKNRVNKGNGTCVRGLLCANNVTIELGIEVTSKMGFC